MKVFKESEVINIKNESERKKKRYINLDTKQKAFEQHIKNPYVKT